MLMSKIDDKTHFTIFESLAELGEHSYEASKKNPGGYWNHLGWDEVEWVGRNFHNDLKNAEKALGELWQEGMDIYDKVSQRLRDVELPRPVSIKRRGAWSEDGGDEIDLDRMRRGQAYWRTTHRDHRPGPMSITIVSNVAANSSKSSMEMMWRGAASVVLTNILEDAGYRVELWAAGYSQEVWTDDKNNVHATCLKRTTDPMDVGALINVLSGWCYRSIYFAQKLMPNRNITMSLGHSISIRKLIPHITSDEQVMVSEDLWDFNAAVRWIRDQLELLKSH